jgi:non-ribosomal peptide synthetase component F
MVELPRTNAADCVHREIESRVQEHPDRYALIFRDTALTYRQLNERADRIANVLYTAGAGPDIPVAIGMDRSLEMVVSMLAVLKAGSAYLPIDPTFPQERIDFILSDGDAHAVLTSRALRERFSDQAVPAICVDADPLPDAPSGGGNSISPTSGEHLAYLMYTSGSTGKPKGVMVEHRNVISFFAAMDRVIGTERPGVWLAVTSISFDISVLELLWTLARGFTVIIQPSDGKLET